MSVNWKQNPNSSKPEPWPGASTSTTSPPPTKKKNLRRLWSKCDVISIMKGIVDYIAIKGVDPVINLGDFVNFVNKKPNSVPTHVFDKISWQLSRVSDDEINYVLRLESNDAVNNINNNNNSTSNDSIVNFNNLSVVGDDKVLNLGKNDGGVRVSSVGSREKKRKRGVDWGKAIFEANVGDSKNMAEKKKKKKKKNGGVRFSSIAHRVKNRKRNVGVEKAVSNENVGASKNTVKKKKNIVKGDEVVKKKQKCKKKMTTTTKKENCLGAKKCKSVTTLVSRKKRRIEEESLSDVGFWQKNEVKLRELQSNMLWCPPKFGVLKWNTDASVREDCAAIGGVLRDWLGIFRCVFSCRVDCSDINEAEVKAIYKAVVLASCSPWLVQLNLVVESDSLNAVRWCNEDHGGPSNLIFMLSFIRMCRMLWKGLEITYMSRKSNTVADHLAKQGHDCSVDFVSWM